MYQHFINENRAHQYQQDCLREAATERALRTGRQRVDNGPGRALPHRPSLAWLIIVVRRVLAVAPTGK